MNLKQLEPTVREIGENKFYITPFPAFRAANLSGELASVLAPLSGVVAAVAGSANDEESKEFDLMNLDVSKIVAGMSGCAELSGDKLEAVMRKLLLGGHIRVEFEDESGEKTIEKLDVDLANELFCGEIQDMYVLCAYVIQLNFNGFFKRLAVLYGAEESAGKPRKMS